MNTKNVLIHKKMGLWMDHSEAKFIDPEKEISSIRTVHSSGLAMERVPGEESDGVRLGNFRSTNNEFHKHRKEENTLREYFEYLAKQLTDFDEIYLFGPTTASHEFYNYLVKEDSSFKGKIHVGNASYLTDHQLVKEVKEYFSTSRKKV